LVKCQGKNALAEKNTLTPVQTFSILHLNLRIASKSNGRHFTEERLEIQNSFLVIFWLS